MDVFPTEFGTLLGKVNKGTSNSGVPLEETPIVAGVSVATTRLLQFSIPLSKMLISH